MTAGKKPRVAGGARRAVTAKNLDAHLGLYANPRADFLNAMRRAGVVPVEPGDVVADGTLHRFRVEGDKPGSRNGWAVLFLDAAPAGAFGSWRLNVSQTWRVGRGELSRAEHQRISVEIERARRRREAEERQRHEAAKARAQALWYQAAEPMPDHPYLARKRIKAHGIRQLDRLLVVPLRDSSGELLNLQFIAADGTKRFLSGGLKRGLYFAIGALAEGLIVAEGYATAASIFEATGTAVAVAFDAGNLEPVARALRAKFPEVRIIVAADNDEGTEGNPGVTKATAAARAVNGAVAIPPEPYNDFNDAAAGCAK